MPAKSMEEIAVYLRELHFRTKRIGGVDVADVWRQLEQLHKEYQAAFDAQGERYRALIAERDAEIGRLKRKIGGGSGAPDRSDG